jgi:succinate dehydrogenase/fumarate reductase cytochrome b subunit
VSGWTETLVMLTSVTGVMIILEAISLAMVPHINAARDAGQNSQAMFTRLHRTSVFLTVAILLLGLTLLAVVAASAAPGL